MITLYKNMMKHLFTAVGLLFLFINSFTTLKGQEVNQAKRDSIFISALRDELMRSLNGLEDKETGKPFFISYCMLNGVLTSAQAMMGALTESSSSDIGDWYLRLMMGSYERNDENFVDPLSQQQNEYSVQIGCPIEPDYRGIRMAFWWNTDNVFRSAVRNYKNKLQAIKEYPLDPETDKLPDYTRAEPVKINVPGSIYEPSNDKTICEKVVREISGLFRNNIEIEQSVASLTAISATVYMVNTEGSEVRIPLNLSVLNLTLSVRDNEDEVLSENITYIAPVVSALPSMDTIKNDALQLCNYLLELKNTEKNREEYNGPILLTKQAAAYSFLSALFEGDNKLFASREPLVYSMKKNLLQRDKQTVESKFEKRIVSKDLSVSVHPHLDEYNGIRLLGKIIVDAEGIVPPDEITLIENGILKNLLSNRIPTPKVSKSNGHYRIGFRMGGFYLDDAPSIIKISSSTTYNHDQLKQQLIELAAERGLEYTYIIKPLIPSASYSPLCFYQVALSTGQEKLVRPFILNNITLNDLNKKIYLSNQIYVSNILFGSYSQYGSNFSAGFPVSMIVPDALLLEDFSLIQPSNDFDLDY
jgi:hypothetical protein